MKYLQTLAFLANAIWQIVIPSRILDKSFSHKLISCSLFLKWHFPTRHCDKYCCWVGLMGKYSLNFYNGYELKLWFRHIKTNFCNPLNIVMAPYFFQICYIIWDLSWILTQLLRNIDCHGPFHQHPFLKYFTFAWTNKSLIKFSLITKGCGQRFFQKMLC